MCDGQYESIVAEIQYVQKKTIVGEIYWVPILQWKESLEKYKLISDKKAKSNTYKVITGTDLNVDYFKLKKIAT